MSRYESNKELTVNGVSTIEELKQVSEEQCSSDYLDYMFEDNNIRDNR